MTYINITNSTDRPLVISRYGNSLTISGTALRTDWIDFVTKEELWIHNKKETNIRKFVV